MQVNARGLVLVIFEFLLFVAEKLQYHRVMYETKSTRILVY